MADAVERLAQEATSSNNVVAFDLSTHIELARSGVSVELDRVAAGLLTRRLGKQVFLVSGEATP